MNWLINPVRKISNFFKVNFDENLNVRKLTYNTMLIFFMFGKKNNFDKHEVLKVLEILETHLKKSQVCSVGLVVENNY